MEQRDIVKAKHFEIFGDRELTDEQRINIAVKSLQESISNIEGKIKSGNIFPEKKEIKKSDADPKTGDAKLELKKVPIGDKYVEVRAYDKDKNILSSDREEVLIKASEVVKVTLDLKEGDLPELTKEELAKIENKLFFICGIFS